jgi:hypothetical protein
MSEGFRMQIDVDAPEGFDDEGFAVRRVCGCRIVTGSVPLQDIVMLTQGYSEAAVLAPDIADLIGATLVIGEPADLARLRELDLPPSEKRRADAAAATNLGLHDVAAWLLRGERGKSSNAMCKAIFGVPDDAASEHPHDPGDLRRCIQLVDAAGASDKLQAVAALSPEWERIVSRWTELRELLSQEMEVGSMAPKTYALIKELIGEPVVAA